MNENRRQILEMLANGKINAEEAERLISALESQSSETGASSANGTPTPKNRAKYLRVVVENNESDGTEGGSKVNIRVPMQLLRAGVKLASFIPAKAREQVDGALRDHGVNSDLSKLSPENLEELIENLNELTVDIDEKNNRVRIFCE